MQRAIADVLRTAFVIEGALVCTPSYLPYACQPSDKKESIEMKLDVALAI